MPPTRRPRLRTLEVTIRVTPDELERLDELAASLGLDRSAALRQLVFGRPLPTALPPGQVADLTRVGRRLNNLTRWANSAQQLPPAEELTPVLDELGTVLDSMAATLRRPRAGN